jgi:hypothetical protein
VNSSTGPQWTPTDLRRLLSPGRFDRYVAAAAGDDLAAIELYVWNNQMGGALHETLGQFEVVLRNALDQQLTEYHRRRLRGSGDWCPDAGMPWANPTRTGRTIDEARDRATAGRRFPEIHGKVVAELSMGFWRYLLAGHSQMTLWAPALYRAFPHMTPARRGPVYDRVNRLHGLRDRVAHHEPIHREDIAARHVDLLEVAG